MKKANKSNLNKDELKALQEAMNNANKKMINPKNKKKKGK
mgnify:CR=1 FL=1